MSDAVALRNEKKKRNPSFIKQSGYKKKRLAGSYRKPRGSDSKIRVNVKGYHKTVRTGFMGPRVARGLSREGKQIVPVANLADLSQVGEGHIALIAKVGQKRKLELLKACVDKKIPVLSIKDPAAKIAAIEKEISEKKEQKKSVAKKEAEEKAKKESAKKPSEKKVADTKKDSAQEADSESEEKKAKEAKDKVLTKRDI